jgi:3-hydroxymyristoyl/3-hydroxydecanoyl-(acyl carrier protein) dehydratase
VIRYAGQLTRVWTGLFVGLGAVNLGLALCATPGGLLEAAGAHSPVTVSRAAWSLFANVFNYIIVAAFFLLEFSYRMRRFPNRPYRNLAEFMRRAAAVAPALAATVRAGAEDSAAQRVLEATLKVPADHPAFDGHFPGRPLLPAVVLLGFVIEAAERGFGMQLNVAGMPWAKFLAPLRPGDGAAVSLRLEHGLLHFEVRRGPVRVARGVFQVEIAPGPS